MTIPVLERKLADRTCSVPSVTRLLALGVGPSPREVHCTGERGRGVFPRPLGLQGRLPWLWVVCVAWAQRVQACLLIQCFLCLTCQTLRWGLGM